MKKIARIILACGVMLAVSVQALASPSIVAGLDKPTSGSNNVTISPVGSDTYTGDLKDEVNQLNDAGADDTVADAFGDFLNKVKPVPEYNAAGDQIEIADVDLKQFRFLTPVVDAQITGEGGDVSVIVNNMTGSMEVYALHFCPLHNKWEVAPAKAVDGNKVTFALHGSGPMAILYKLKGEITHTGTSPQTGERSVAGAFGMMAVLCAAFSVYAVKKSRKAA